MYSGKNFSYAIDADHKFVAISDGMLEMYPHLRCGQVCHKALYESDTPCEVCPLLGDRNQELTVFNPVIDKWVNVICTDVDWPGSTGCTLLACSVIDDPNAGIMRRIPHMAGYDVFFEMNLTRNKFRRFFRSTDARAPEYEDEGLDELLDRTCDDLVHPLDQQRFKEFWDLSTMMERLNEAGGTLHNEFVERSTRGGWDLVHTTIVPDVSMNGHEDIVVAMYTVIRSPQLAQIALKATSDYRTRRPFKLRESAYSHLARPDDFLRILDKRIRIAKPNTLAVVRFDVENFRFFNHWIGREAGDALIEAFSRELLMRDTDYNILPCRISDENFAFVIPLDYDLANHAADNLRQILKEACGTMDFRLRVGACAVTSNDLSAEMVLDRARLAARASLLGPNQGITWHNEDTARENEQRMHTLAEIHTALTDGSFEPYFQPKYHMETGQLVGAEALARWIHPVRGVVSPGAFVPLLEEKGEIARLDQIIWEKTFATMRSWLDKGLCIPPISVNVSRYDLNSLDISAEMHALSQKYNVPAHLVEIELTESAFSNDAESVTEAITNLHTHGFTVSIDDFGSGYSSLNLLKSVPADILKLDLKFLDFNSENATKGQTIIQSIVGMANTLGIPLVVEGIETQDQADMLLQLNCRYAQGFLYSKPMPSGTFQQLVQGAALLPEGICAHYAATGGIRTALAQSEFDDAMLNSLSTPVVMYELDGTDVNIVKFNEHFSRIIGASELMRRAHGIQEYVAPEDLPKMYGAMKRAIANPAKTTHCHMTFSYEDGRTEPFVISLNFASQRDGKHYFLGMPNPLDEADIQLVNSKMQVINRHWLNDLVALGDLDADMVEDLLGPICLYFLKDGEVYMKGGNHALLAHFGETPEALAHVSSRDALKSVHVDDTQAFVDALENAIAAEGARVDCVMRFLKRTSGTYLTCHLGLHFVRQYDGGYEFLSSVVVE